MRYDNIKFTGTWPNRFKYGLQFYLDGSTVAVLGFNKVD